MRIALSQLTTGTDPARNLELIERETRRAAEAGARVVVFPEASMTCFGTSLQPVAEPLDGP
ncbi:acyltransferase, partial [Streptomyces sp. TRM76130]|nr:acyltransferase [Streptomyces sp. TRM76130]